MSELKRLLQTLQPVVPISPASFSQEDEERSSRRMEEDPLSSSSPSCHTEFDVLSTSAFDSFFPGSSERWCTVFPSGDIDWFVKSWGLK